MAEQSTQRLMSAVSHVEGCSFWKKLTLPTDRDAMQQHPSLFQAILLTVLYGNLLCIFAGSGYVGLRW